MGIRGISVYIQLGGRKDKVRISFQVSWSTLKT